MSLWWKSSVVLLLSATLHPYSYAEHEDHESVVIAHDLLRDTTYSAIGIPLSPSCWASAIAFLGSPGSDAASFCANLPETSQKRLALELARCHLEDTQKPLFHSHWTAKECTKVSPITVESLRSCLSGLTEAGDHAYSHYIPYVQALCTRKTQELFLQHQQSIKDSLASEYAKMSRASIEHMESIHHATAKHAEEMSTKLEDISSVIQSQIAEQLGELVQKELGDRLAEAMQHQTKEQSQVFHEILSSIQLQDLERKQQQDDWAHYQSGVMLKQAKEMERQREALRESRARIEDLSSKVSQTSSHMQPLVGLQTMMTVVSEGYSWISFLLYFLASFNVVWVTTRPDRCHRFRSYIFAVVVAEAVVELCFKVVVAHGLMEEAERIDLTTELRRMSILLECIAYLVGMLLSCFASSSITDSPEPHEVLVERHVGNLTPSCYMYPEYEDPDCGSVQYNSRKPTYYAPDLPIRGRLAAHHLVPSHVKQPTSVLQKKHQRSPTVGRSTRSGQLHNCSRMNTVPAYSGNNQRSSQLVDRAPLVSPHSPVTLSPSARQPRDASFKFVETIDEPPREPSPLRNIAAPTKSKRSAASLPITAPNAKRIHLPK